MTKSEFTDSLREQLANLPQDELDKAIAFFEESIDDRIEDGKTEEEAVSDLGSPEDAAAKVLHEIPLPYVIFNTVKPKGRMTWWQILLVCLGFPLWLPLIAAFFILIFVFYLAVWILIFALFICVVSFFIAGIVSVISTVPYVSSIGFLGFSGLAAGLILIGIGLLLIIPSIELSKLLIKGTGKVLHKIKSAFIRK